MKISKKMAPMTIVTSLALLLAVASLYAALTLADAPMNSITSPLGEELAAYNGSFSHLENLIWLPRINPKIKESLDTAVKGLRQTNGTIIEQRLFIRIELDRIIFIALAISLGIILCVVMAYLILTLIFTRFIGRNIKSINSSVCSLNQGDISLRTSISSKEELGRDLNGFSEILTESVAHIAREVDTSRTAQQKLSEATEESSASTRQIGANAESRNRQMEVLKETSSIVAEEIRKLAEASSANSTEISGILEEMIENVQAAHESGQSTRDAFKNLSMIVDEVQEAYETINRDIGNLESQGGGILDYIEELNRASTSVADSSGKMREQSGIVESSMEAVQRVSGEGTYTAETR